MNTRIPLYAQCFGDTLIAPTELQIPCGAGPIPIIYGFGSLWIGCTNAQTVERRDLNGILQATIALGTGHLAEGLCVGAGSIWIADAPGAQVLRVDPSTNAVIASIPVGAGPLHVCFDGAYIWSSNNGAGSISKIDPSTNTVSGSLGPVTTPSYRMCFDGTNLWVGDWTGDRVARVNLTTGATTYVTGISEPWGMCFDGASVWVSSYGSGALYAIDPVTSSIIASVALETGAGPHEVIPVKDEIWVANSSTNHVQCVGALEYAVRRTFSTASDPAGLCDDGSGSVWVTAALGNTIMRRQIETRWT